MLYQRYFLKMNQSNMTNLITLLLFLCISLLILAGSDLVMRNNAEKRIHQEMENNSQERLDKLVVLLCTSGCCIAIYGGKYFSMNIISKISVNLRNRLFSAFFLFTWKNNTRKRQDAYLI